MAAQVKQNRQYSTYGNVAYRASYDGTIVQAPPREEVPAPYARPQRQVRTRKRVRVREAGEISVFAVLGFAILLTLSILVIFNYSQVNEIHTQTVQLQSKYTNLKKEEVSLLAREQMAYDLQTIERQETENGSMSKPKSSQEVILSATDGDNAVLYENKDNSALSLIGQAWDDVCGQFSNVLSYFQ